MQFLIYPLLFVVIIKQFFFEAPSLTAPVCAIGQWTEFFNRDSPRGDGDSETLREINMQFPGRACSNPTAVDAQLVWNGKDYRLAGQVIHINTTLGLVCLNREQAENINCLNYRVRFCCPSMLTSVNVRFLMLMFFFVE